MMLRRYKPLFFNNGNIVFFHNGGLWRLADHAPEHIVSLSKPSLFDNSRLIVRLLRREPRIAVPIGNDRVIIALRGHLVLADLSKRTVQSLCQFREGFSSPLNICKATSQWLLVWGDYGRNTNSDSVNIYGLNNDLKTEVIYTFPPKMVRHVHNIIPSKDNGYYILTGDHEPTSGIYYSDCGFQKVRPVKTGEQKYRAVVGFDTPQGLLYATDAVNEINCVYLLTSNGSISQICQLNGSCIYGKEFDGDYYFATSVEPDDTIKGMRYLFSYTRGSGILSNDVTLVRLDRHFNSTTVKSFKKDLFPAGLFQFGSIQFPFGHGPDFWMYPVGVKDYDLTPIKL